MEYTLNRNSSLFKYKPYSQKLVWMRPDEFLELAPPKVPGFSRYDESVYSKESLKSIINGLKAGSKFDPLFLDVDIRTCRVINHEGRHRAFAAYKLGIEKVPVIIFHREEGYFVDIGGKSPCCENDKCNLKPQKY